MNYCILGDDGVRGGFVVEMRIDMERWCADHCKGGYAVLHHGEIKFEHETDAKRFAKAWFMPENFELRTMQPDCNAALCADRHNVCPLYAA